MTELAMKWNGTILGVQPRVLITRSFDQRSHSYLGYILRIRGTLGEEEREFLVAIGDGAQEKHQFRAGMQVQGMGYPVADTQLEVAHLYKVKGLQALEVVGEAPSTKPPWLSPPPRPNTYQERGHRRLDARTYESKCSTCLWGCLMAVEMIIDHWDPRVRRYRQETFCYGPLSCPLYRAGPTRKVPGRKGMTWEEEDWVDQEDVSHRGPDE